MMDPGMTYHNNRILSRFISYADRKGLITSIRVYKHNCFCSIDHPIILIKRHGDLLRAPHRSIRRLQSSHVQSNHSGGKHYEIRSAHINSRARQSGPDTTLHDVAAIYTKIRKQMSMHPEVPRWFETLSQTLSPVQHLNDANRQSNLPTVFDAAQGWEDGEPKLLDVIEYLSDLACIEVTLH